MEKFGIDISSYQNNINIKSIKNSVSFIILRAGFTGWGGDGTGKNKDNCFEKIYDYENLPLDDKIELLNKFKKLKKLKGVNEDILRITENCDELRFFRDNYQDFNPLLKEQLDQ